VFDARELAVHDACATARSWLLAFDRMTPNAASGWVKRARILRQLPALRAAGLSGSVSIDHLRMVLALVHRLDLPTVTPFDALLAKLAATVTPAQLQIACERIIAHADPDGPHPDPHAAFERRGLTLSRTGSMVALRGQLDPEAGAALMTALDATMTPPRGDDPRTPAQRRADALAEMVRQTLGAGRVGTVHGVRPHLGILLSPNTLLTHPPANPPPPDPTGPGSADRTRPDPSSDPSGHRATDDGSPPADDPGSGSRIRHLFIAPPLPPQRDPWLGGADPDDEPPPLRHRLTYPPPHKAPPPQTSAERAWQAVTDAGVQPLPEAARLDWYGGISAAIAQRVSCDCDVWRAVLDPATGLPLEVGRTHRLVPSWMRRALQARDQGCRFPGCTAPVAWTDAHHWIPWYDGGETNIDNLLSLCRFHHVTVHEGRWTLAWHRATGAVYAYRPDCTPYEIGPSLPRTGPTRPGDPSRVA
jgi:hypothetical protein